MIYLIIIIILLVNTKYDKYIWNKYSLILFKFEWFVLVLLSALRYRIGGDTMAYMDQYEFLPSLLELTWQEAVFNVWGFQPLYLFFVGICKFFTDEYLFFQIVHAICVNSIVFWFIKKYSQRPFLVVLFYFVLIFPNYNMEILKQSLTNCCFLLSIPYLINKQWVKYYAFAFVGFGFHSAGIILLLLPLFFHTLGHKNIKKYTFYTLVGLIAINMFLVVINVYLKNLGMVSLSSDLDTYGGNISNINGLIMGLITKFLLPFIYLVYYKGTNSISQSFTALYIILIGLSASLVFLYRIIDMFEIPFYIALTNYYYELRRNHLKSKSVRLGFKISKLPFYLTIIMIVFLFSSKFSFYMQNLSSNAGTRAHRYDLYIPYSSIINPQEYGVREALYYDFITK